MNQAWNSFLQTVFQFVKSLFVNVSKKMHRNAVVLTTGIAVVTVVTFTAGDFEGGGKSALVAFAETPESTGGDEAASEDMMEDSAAQETEMEMSEEDGQESEEKQETQSEELESEEVPETEGTEEEEKAGTETGAEKSADDEEKAADSLETDEEAEGITVVDEDGLEDMEGDTAVVYACSDKDYNVLLKIVQAEAGGCDTKGRILVANVILNRVESDEFPDTISGVVYEKSQFSPVSNGTINSCKVTEETIEAVDRALAGEDYSEGALYFMNRKASSGRNVRWFDNHLEYLFKHGNHEFFK